jgi:hypothetical protein
MHKSIRTVIFAALFSVLLATTGRADPATVVKINGIDKSVTYEALGREELANLKKRIQIQQRYFQQGLANAIKAWKADESNEGVPFVSSSVSAPRMQEMGTFEREVAEKKVAAYGDREFDKTAKEAARLKAMKTKARERQQERNARQAARDAAAQRFAPLVQAEIEKLAPKE